MPLTAEQLAATWYSTNGEEYTFEDYEDALQELWDNRETCQAEFTIYAGHITDIPIEDGELEGMYQMGETWPVKFKAVDPEEAFPKWQEITKE